MSQRAQMSQMSQSQLSQRIQISKMQFVGLDFGTQNTCVAIRRDAPIIDETTPLSVRLNQITIVQGWKGYRADPGVLSTAIMYHKQGGQAGWGNGVINFLVDSDGRDKNNNTDLIDVIVLPNLALHKSEKVNASWTTLQLLPIAEPSVQDNSPRTFQRANGTQRLFRQ